MIARVAVWEPLPDDDRQWVFDAAKTVNGVRESYHLVDPRTGGGLSIAFFDDDATSGRGRWSRVTRLEWGAAVLTALVLGGLTIAAPDILEAPFENARTVVFTLGGSAAAAVTLVVMLRLRVHPVARIIVLGVPFVAVSWWLLSPFFVDDVVDDDFPTSIADASDGSAQGAGGDDTGLADAGPAPSFNEPLLLGAGEFVGLAGHNGSGDAGLFALQDGTRILRLENMPLVPAQCSGPPTVSRSVAQSPSPTARRTGDLGDGTRSRRSCPYRCWMVPSSHSDLLERAVPAVLATLLPSGRPHASVVWFDHWDGRLRVNSERGRKKVANLERDPRATLIVVDPNDQHRYVEFRCDVESISEDGASAHRDQLDARYLGPDHRSDPSNDRGARVIITLNPAAVHAYGSPEPSGPSAGAEPVDRRAR